MEVTVTITENKIQLIRYGVKRMSKNNLSRITNQRKLKRKYSEIVERRN